MLVLLGSVDWLTTTIGILYFGAVECNPFLAGLTVTNMPAFAAIKLATTAFVVLVFILAEKILMKTPNKSSKAFVRMHYLVRGAYIAAILFLGIAVLNNIVAIVRIA